jgi:hypothetical protein
MEAQAVVSCRMRAANSCEGQWVTWREICSAQRAHHTLASKGTESRGSYEKDLTVGR